MGKRLEIPADEGRESNHGLVRPALAGRGRRRLGSGAFPSTAPRSTTRWSSRAQVSGRGESHPPALAE